MTWSAANDPMMTSGSRRDRIAAASPIAAAESRGSDSRKTFLSAIVGQLLLDRRAVCATRHDRDAVGPGERLEAVPRVAQEGVAGAGEIVEELGGVGTGQRPQPAADSAGGDHGVEVLDGLRHGSTVIGGSVRRISSTCRGCAPTLSMSREFGGGSVARAIGAVLGWKSASARSAPARNDLAPSREDDRVRRHTFDTVGIRDHLQGPAWNAVPRARGHVVVGAAPHHRRGDLLLPARARARHRPDPASRRRRTTP